MYYRESVVVQRQFRLENAMGRIMLIVLCFVALSSCTATTLSSSTTGALEQSRTRDNIYAPEQPRSLTRLTGTANSEACVRWSVCGTDLGIPYLRRDGSVGITFGDTFSSSTPDQGSGWRSPVILHSSSDPKHHTIKFSGAAGVQGDGYTPEVTGNGHNSGGEVSAIPNDVVVLPDGRQVMSLQSVSGWPPGTWTTNYSELALSTDDGNSFRRTGVRWGSRGGKSATQMTSMQLDGNYVYMISVRAGRVNGLMFLRRVPWRDILTPQAYLCWNGTDWVTTCSDGILRGRFGEPSLRKLQDGTWVMAYFDLATGAVVTRYADQPTGKWSAPTVQITYHELDFLYGGFIHPLSTKNNLTLMVSSWQRHSGVTHRYDVSQLSGLSIYPAPRKD